MRRSHQFISSFLALCLMLASAVGISPVLHVWLEHGGEGAAHNHWGGIAGTSGGWHVHPRGFGHDHNPFLDRSFPRGVFVRSDQTGDVPSTPTKNDPYHGHHSLAQLLASGLIEFAVDLPILKHEPPPVIFISSSPEVLLPSGAWNAQTPSRGPPVSRS